MHHVDVTVSVSYHYTFELDLNDEEYDDMLDDSGVWNEMITDMYEATYRKGDCYEDYAVYDNDKHEQLIEWNLDW